MKRFSKILAVLLILSVVPVSAVLTGCAVVDAEPSTPKEQADIIEVVEQPELTEQDIEILKESCVMIYADNGETEVQGSGVAIGENKYLSVYHAIEDGRTHVKTFGGEKLTISKTMPTIDIMMLESASSAIPAKIGDIGDSKSGDKIVVIGAPDGNDDTVTRTTINRIVGVIVIDGATVGGASGSGVFDMRGNLIGIVTRTDTELGESYAVTINTIKKSF